MRVVDNLARPARRPLADPVDEGGEHQEDDDDFVMKAKIELHDDAVRAVEGQDDDAGEEGPASAKESDEGAHFEQETAAEKGRCHRRVVEKVVFHAAADAADILQPVVKGLAVGFPDLQGIIRGKTKQVFAKLPKLKS